MKIAINSLFLETPASGSGQYLLHLLQELKELDRHNEYLLLGARPLAPHLQALPYPYQETPVPSPAARHDHVAKLMWEQYSGPAAARRGGADLLHVPYFAPPLFPRTPTVVTIHDVIPLRLPAYRAKASVRAYMRLVTLAARRATLIITVSQHARRDIMDALQLPAERIRVTYEAAGEQYRPITDPAVLAQARARYGIGERYIFYLGGLDQRKNVPQLVRAFAHLYKQLDQPDLQLFISGDPARQKGALFPDPRPVAAELGVAERVLFRFVSDEDKAVVYSGASLFVFPSLYEGFGLDPLEAMSCGAPVVCSNRTSLPEVVGDAALSVDPDDMRSLVEAMRSVLTNRELADDLRARSLRRAAGFNWRKTAAETLAVYTEALARHKR